MSNHDPIDPADIRPGDVVERVIVDRITVTANERDVIRGIRPDGKGAGLITGPVYWADATWHLVHRPDPDAEAVDALAGDLYRWWMDTAHVEAEACASKAAEYGSNSMTELGHDLAKMAGREVTDQQATELACYFYIKGKMGRWSDAVARGEAVSDDTLGDIGVYVRMAQRVRSNGGWPGTPTNTV